MANLISDVTVTPTEQATISGVAFDIPGEGAFALDFATIVGAVSFLGYQNTPAGRPSQGQLWPRGDTLA